MSTSITLSCTSCGDPVSALVEFRGPVTLCGACTPEHWDGVSLPRGVYDWPALLDLPTNLVSYADDGIDVPDAERDALDRIALVGDDGRDEFGELREERAEPHVRRDAA